MRLVGAGLGAFTPANNAAIMEAAPRSHSGLAGCILNMTRGLSAAPGVALTGAVFTLLSGSAAQVRHLTEDASLTLGFAGAMAFLAAIALVAALPAALRGGHHSSVL